MNDSQDFLFLYYSRFEFILFLNLNALMEHAHTVHFLTPRAEEITQR